MVSETRSLSLAFAWRLLGFIGFGFRSASFLARLTVSQTSRTVVLKVYWDQDDGERDIEAMVAVDGIQGMPKLIAPAVLSRDGLMTAARDLLSPQDGQRLQTVPRQPLVAFMTWVGGEPLVRADERAAEFPDWSVSVGDRQWREGWRFGLDPEGRRALFVQLAEILENCHSLARPVTHGDLSPANVLYDPRSGRLAVTRYVSWAPLGTPGWRSPWHGDGAALTPAADVYVLLLWGLRLLPETAQPELLAMLDGCAQPNPRDVDLSALDVLDFCHGLAC